MLRRLVILLVCLALPSAALPAIDEARLPAAVVNALKTAGIPQSAVAVVVEEVGSRQARLEINAQQPFNPASLMKLVTTLAALETLGPAYTWRTEVLTTNPPENGVLSGDLYLRGAGDPKLTYDRLWLLLRELRGRGLREIRGDLVLDRSAFAPWTHDPAAFDGKPLRPYNVGPDALLFNFATLHLTLVPQAGTVRVLAEPLPAGFAIVNRLRLVDRPQCGEWREALEARLTAGQLTLSGDFSLSCGERRWHLAGLNNANLLHGVFTRFWQELGGQFSGQVREDSAPATAVPFAIAESPPLGEIVRDINKFSNNVMAQQVYLTLGQQGGAGSRQTDSLPEGGSEPGLRAREAIKVGAGPSQADLPPVGGSEPGLRARGAIKVGAGPSQADLPPVGGSEPGLRARGANNVGADGTAADAAVRAWLTTRKLDFPELVIDNGAGLSRRSRIAAASLARLLQTGWASPAMPEFIASLPIAASDGTLKKKLNGNGAAGRAHLKTGSLEGVRGIAGYLLDRNGRRHIVVFMVNHPKAGAAQPAFDALLEWLWAAEKR